MIDSEGKIHQYWKNFIDEGGWKWQTEYSPGVQRPISTKVRENMFNRVIPKEI